MLFIFRGITFFHWIMAELMVRLEKPQVSKISQWKFSNRRFWTSLSGGQELTFVLRAEQRSIKVSFSLSLAKPTVTVSSSPTANLMLLWRCKSSQNKFNFWPLCISFWSKVRRVVNKQIVIALWFSSDTYSSNGSMWNVPHKKLQIQFSFWKLQTPKICSSKSQQLLLARLTGTSSRQS